MKRRISTCFVAIAFAAPAWAQEGIELKGCLTNDMTVIDRAADVIIGMNVSRGMVDKVAGPAWFADKAIQECRVVFDASPAGMQFSNRCNLVDAKGDKIISVANGDRSSFEWKWIGGTGKYEGITGGGTAKFDALYPRTGTTGATCWSGKGVFSIKKL